MTTRTGTRLRDAGGRVWRIGGIAAGLALAVGVTSGASGERAARAVTGRTAGPAVTAVALPATIEFRSATTVAGTVSGPGGTGEGGQLVALERDEYPYAGYQVVGRTTTATDGSYSFGGLVPDRDTRYEVLEVSTPGLVSPVASVVVDTPVVTRVTTLAGGELRISATAEHSRAFGWNDREARWYVSTGGGPAREVAESQTREAEAGTTELSATFYPPSGPFSYRACFTAPGAKGLGLPTAGTPCEVAGTAVGNPSPAVPSAGEIAAAEQFLDGRSGQSGFAVVDSHGLLSGVRMHERFHSASLIKAMLLVAYLRGVAGAHRELTDADRDILGPMIHVSDNDAASAAFAVVGESGLVRLASVAGMTDFSPSPYWGLSEISAADQARFFAEQDSLIPAEFVGYARSLLSHIDPSQQWGIPAGVAGRYTVFFKGGWLPDRGIVNQAARLEGHGVSIALAILTSGGPGMAYGEATLEGTTARLLG